MATSVPIRIAAVLGASFAAIAVVAGTRVLTGIDVPDYVVHRWLVWSASRDRIRGRIRCR